MDSNTPEKVYGGWERVSVRTLPGWILPLPRRAKKVERRWCEAGAGRILCRCGRRPIPRRREDRDGAVNGFSSVLGVRTRLSFGRRVGGRVWVVTLLENG
jgi:hypothetical protein